MSFPILLLRKVQTNIDYEADLFPFYIKVKYSAIIIIFCHAKSFEIKLVS